jgi:hypothetical protein
MPGHGCEEGEAPHPGIDRRGLGAEAFYRAQAMQLSVVSSRCDGKGARVRPTLMYDIPWNDSAPGPM